MQRHTSQPPNSDVASAFFRTGLIEASGRGYERIAEACREQGTPEPAVKSDRGGVRIQWAWVNPASDADRIRPQTEAESQLESQLVSRVLATLGTAPLRSGLAGKPSGLSSPGPTRTTTMNIHPIRNDDDHGRAMSEIERLSGSPEGTPEADALEVLVTLVDAYEAKHHAIEPPVMPPL